MSEYKSLLVRAKMDIKEAKRFFNERAVDDLYLDYAGYFAQQSIEKVLKYQLELEGVKYPFTHNIEELIRYANDSDIDLKIPEYIDDHAEMLSSWEAKTRYAGNISVEERKIKKALPYIEEYIQSVEKRIEKEMTTDTSKILADKIKNANKKDNKKNTIPNINLKDKIK